MEFSSLLSPHSLLQSYQQSTGGDGAAGRFLPSVHWAALQLSVPSPATLLSGLLEHALTWFWTSAVVLFRLLCRLLCQPLMFSP